VSYGPVVVADAGVVPEADGDDVEDDVEVVELLDGVVVLLDVLPLVVVLDGEVVLDGVEELLDRVVELVGDVVLWACDGVGAGLLFEPEDAASAIATPTTIAASTAPANSQIRLGERSADCCISAVGSAAGGGRFGCTRVASGGGGGTTGGTRRVGASAAASSVGMSACVSVRAA